MEDRAAGAETIHGSTATGYNDLRPIPSFLPWPHRITYLCVVRTNISSWNPPLPWWLAGSPNGHEGRRKEGTSWPGGGSAKKAAAAAARACTHPMGGSVIPDVDDVAALLRHHQVMQLMSPICHHPKPVAQSLYSFELSGRLLTSGMRLHKNRLPWPGTSPSVSDRDPCSAERARSFVSPSSSSSTVRFNISQGKDRYVPRKPNA